MTHTLLDCFQGMAGTTEGFYGEGFECVGIEIEPKIARYGKRFGDVIVADMRTLNGENFKGFDVIWGSPPCRDFTSLTFLGHRWKNPPNVEKGLELVSCFLKFVEDAKPKFWILENSPNLRKYLQVKPTQISRIGKNMIRGFWGSYPSFLMPSSLKEIWFYDVKKNPKRIEKYYGKLRSWERAKIPLPCSQAFAKACKEALEKSN